MSIVLFCNDKKWENVADRDPKIIFKTLQISFSVVKDWREKQTFRKINSEIIVILYVLALQTRDSSSIWFNNSDKIQVPF